MIITKSPHVLLSLFLMAAGSYFTPVVASAYTLFGDRDELKIAVDEFCGNTFDSNSTYGWVDSCLFRLQASGSLNEVFQLRKKEREKDVYFHLFFFYYYYTFTNNNHLSPMLFSYNMNTEPKMTIAS